MGLTEEILLFLATNQVAITSLRELALILVGIIGLVFLGLRAVGVRRSAEAAMIQAEISGTELIVDRYIKAIDQLGSKELAIRHGGIYGLEQVAIISEELRSQIFEVLTAFVRSETVKDGRDHASSTTTDIQAIITILGRINRHGVKIEKSDFTGSTLRGYEFDGDYSGSIFDSADLTGSDLSKSTFLAAKFRSANCRGITAQFANFKFADFRGADCRGSDLSGSNIQFANFISAHHEDTNFDECSDYAVKFEEDDVDE